MFDEVAQNKEERNLRFYDATSTTLLIYSLLIELKFLKATKIGMVWEAVAALPENSPTSSPLSPTTTMLPAPKNLNLPNLPHHHSDATLVSPPIRTPALS
jgi:hypothetical protein